MASRNSQHYDVLKLHYCNKSKFNELPLFHTNTRTLGRSERTGDVCASFSRGTIIIFLINSQRTVVENAKLKIPDVMKISARYTANWRTRIESTVILCYFRTKTANTWGPIWRSTTVLQTSITGWAPDRGRSSVITRCTSMKCGPYFKKNSLKSEEW